VPCVPCRLPTRSATKKGRPCAGAPLILARARLGRGDQSLRRLPLRGQLRLLNRLSRCDHLNWASRDLRNWLLLAQEEDWVRARKLDGGIRDGVEVIELTQLYEVKGWPNDRRVISRRERPHPRRPGARRVRRRAATPALTRKNYACTSATRASGPKKTMLARCVRNRRLATRSTCGPSLPSTRRPVLGPITTPGGQPATDTTRLYGSSAIASSESSTAAAATTLPTTNRSPGGHRSENEFAHAA
jgi:hypothetical protein